MFIKVKNSTLNKFVERLSWVSVVDERHSRNSYTGLSHHTSSSHHLILSQKYPGKSLGHLTCCQYQINNNFKLQWSILSFAWLHEYTLWGSWPLHWYFSDRVQHFLVNILGGASVRSYLCYTQSAVRAHPSNRVVSPVFTAPAILSRSSNKIDATEWYAEVESPAHRPDQTSHLPTLHPELNTGGK